MKKALLLISPCVCIGIAIYFMQRKNLVAEKMEKLYGQKISLPTETMRRFVPNDYAGTLEKDAKYKIVLFHVHKMR